MKRLAILLLLITASCAPPRPQPVPPMPPPPGMVAVTFLIQDGAGHPIAQAQIAGVGHIAGDWMAATNDVGLLLVTLTPDQYALTITASGYLTRELPANVNGAGTITIGLESLALPRLITRGQFFALQTGERWTAIEASDFHLLGRYLDGENIEPVLEQRAALGFNLLRVWTRYDLRCCGIGRSTLADHPDLYDRIPAFVRAAAGHGLYIEFTAYTGREDFDPNHWTRLGAALQGQTSTIAELVNENDQSGNHIDVTPFAPLPGILSSLGSNGSQAAPVGFVWHPRPTPDDPNDGVWLPDHVGNYATFHTNSAPEEARKVGHNAMEWWSGPTLTNETSRAPDQYTSTMRAFDSAAGAALLAAGSCFHSVHGKDSTLWTGAELEAAKAWADGAKSVNLACQAGGYRHRTDLETSGILRAYDRNVPGIDCAVRIRQ